jgi:hypothetical protein
MGTENVPQYHEWKAVMDNEHISGTFLWTGIQYMGEVRDPWPAKSGGGALLDLAGFKTPAWHMYKTLWDNEPHLYMTTNIHDQIKYWGKQLYKINQNLEVEEFIPDAWEHFVWGWQSVNEHWNYNENDTTIVEVITNCDEVELFLNDQSLGSKKRADFADNILKWAVVYQPGKLKAIGKNNSTDVYFEYQTTGKPDAIVVKIDKKSLKSDAYDVAHIEVQLVDKNENPVQNDDRLIKFEVDEKLQLLGVDNGSPLNVQDFQSNQIITDKGRALLIVQSKGSIGNEELKILSEGLPEQILQIDITHSNLR